MQYFILKIILLGANFLLKENITVPKERGHPHCSQTRKNTVKACIFLLKSLKSRKKLKVIHFKIEKYVLS